MDEKTEKATPKKRRDAKERGQVLKSTELNTAFCSVIMYAFLMMMWPSITQKMAGLYRHYLGVEFASAVSGEMTTPMLQNVYLDVLFKLGAIVLPVLGVAILAGVAINVVQVGFMFTTKPLEPKLDRISPIQGFKRIFSSRTVAELLKSILKTICLGYIFYGEYTKLFDRFPGFMGLELYTAFVEIMNMAFMIALKMSCVLLIIAGFDFLYQWWKYEKDLMMTKQEIKDEYKLTEGDPQIKQRIRQKQRQMSAMRMMQRVPSSDVVITNPTHFAVALRYDQDRGGAPVVVAKGADYMARKIREVAAEHRIEIVENAPLARSLYSMCELDDEIPVELYQAVADVLVYVYRQKQTMR